MRKERTGFNACAVIAHSFQTCPRRCAGSPRFAGPGGPAAAVSPSRRRAVCHPDGVASASNYGRVRTRSSENAVFTIDPTEPRKLGRALASTCLAGTHSVMPSIRERSSVSVPMVKPSTPSRPTALAVSTLSLTRFDVGISDAWPGGTDRTKKAHRQAFLGAAQSRINPSAGFCALSSAFWVTYS